MKLGVFFKFNLFVLTTDFPFNFAFNTEQSLQKLVLTDFPFNSMAQSVSRFLLFRGINDNLIQRQIT